MPRLIVALLALAMSSGAFAADQREAWICTWPGVSADQRPVIGRFHVEGDNLIEDRFNLPHRILQNTPFGIVAAWSIAEVEPHHTQPSIGAFVVIIDKRTLLFRSSGVILTAPKEATSYGSCIQG